MRNLLFRNPFVRRYGGKSCYDKFLRNMDFRNLFVRRYGRRENLFMSNILEIYEKSFFVRRYGGAENLFLRNL